MVNLIERMPGKALAEAYQNRLLANEVMLLPYYVASLNIEKRNVAGKFGSYPIFLMTVGRSVLQLVQGWTEWMAAPLNGIFQEQRATGARSGITAATARHV